MITAVRIEVGNVYGLRVVVTEIRDERAVLEVVYEGIDVALAYAARCRRYDPEKTSVAVMLSGSTR